MCDTRTIATKNAFSFNHLFLYWSPEDLLKVPCRSQTLGPSGDTQETLLGRRMLTGNRL